MATWYELADQAEQEAQQMVPVGWLSWTNLMTWLTEAQHRFQTATSIVKRPFQITLDPTSTTGIYDIPTTCRKIDRLTWAKNSSDISYYPVHLVNYQTYQNYINNAQHVPRLGGLGAAQVLQEGPELVCSVTYNKLYLYPYRGITGVLNMRYIPHLRPFSPGNTDEWSGYGTDPTASMKMHGPEVEFMSAEWAMKEYAIAQVIAKAPSGMKLFGTRYTIAMQNFSEAMADVRKINVDYNQGSASPYFLGGID